MEKDRDGALHKSEDGKKIVMEYYHKLEDGKSWRWGSADFWKMKKIEMV